MLVHVGTPTDLINQCRVTFLDEKEDEWRSFSALGKAAVALLHGSVEACLGQTTRGPTSCPRVVARACALAENGPFISVLFLFPPQSKDSLKFTPEHIRYHTGGLQEEQTTQYGLKSH